MPQVAGTVSDIGSISGLLARFLSLVGVSGRVNRGAEDIRNAAEGKPVTRIHYSDRYLQNPVALALLGGLLKR